MASAPPYGFDLDVALVTCAALAGLAPDDRPLLAALRARGLRTEPVVWEDRYHDWNRTRVAVIRSAWDYAFRRAQFLAWAERASAATTLWNPLPVVRWNTHKHYLLDLAARGVPTVPTLLVPAGTSLVLADVLAERGWREAVVKPAVAQSGRYATRASVEDPGRAQDVVQRLLPHEDLLIQPFVPAVGADGELSVVFVDGEVTHAVRKRAAPGDFRVHDDHGGSVAPAAPDPAEEAVARDAVRAADAPLLYARVDLVRGVDGAPLVMELELVEPELFLTYSDVAVARLADAIVRRLDPAERLTARTRQPPGC
jgi:glutathione synthase/RimK-type ligase-like ATP-grasp enzyme